MEVLTLLKANIRHKKGSFVSIIILMLIISLTFTAIISIKNNCENGIEDALDSVDCSDVTLFMDAPALTDELLDIITAHSSVKRLTVTEAIRTYCTDSGAVQDMSSWAMVKLTSEYRLLNEDLSGYAETVPALKQGEIYVSQGVGTKFECGIGDTLKIDTVGGTKEFTIKGFVVEPMYGVMNMGIKQVFISDEDFATLQQEAIALSTERQQGDIRIVRLYKADENLTDGQFKRQLNKDTGIVDFSFLAITREQSFTYTNIYPNIILSALLVFVAFLVAVVLIVMAHSISTSIEMEYTSLGVLKAQGFTEGKIKLILGAQYLLAQIIGAVLGVILALPLIYFFGSIFQPILAIPSSNHVSMLASILFTLAVLVISALFLIFATRKVGKISPMKAISGGKNEIYFNSRLNAPISQKGLSTSLAFRQFTSNKRRYISTILIVMILMFFMITMSVMGASMDSESAMLAMGLPITELTVTSDESISDETLKDIENIVERHTNIVKKCYFDYASISINGDEYSCNVYKNPDFLIMEEGRAPQYDNEIVVTSLLAKELDLEIGDKVMVSSKNLQAEYIITGFNIFANDLGLNFSIPLESAKKLGIADTYTYSFNLEDGSASAAIAEELTAKYGDTLKVVANEEDSILDMYTGARTAMIVIIYVISILFSLVVVMMFCKKAFLQERRDIGIYKSLGFTSGKLRLQFAIRFLIVSLIGSALGAVLSLFLTEPVLKAVFRIIGVWFNAKFSPIAFLVPVAIIAVSFFSFSYVASRKIKTVEIKELVTE